jgi:branched-chain amino acid transport system substrate-binding protein
MENRGGSVFRQVSVSRRIAYVVVGYFVIMGSVFAAFGGTSGAAGSASLGASQGVTAKTITIGLSTGLQGAEALAGQQEQSGVKAAINQVNAAGGIDGRKIKLVSLNDSFDPTNQAVNFRQLATQSDVYAMVGTPWFVTTEIYPEDKTLGVPLFPLFSYPNPDQKSIFLIGGTTTAQTVATIPEIASIFKGKGSVSVGELAGATTSSAELSAVAAELKKYPNLHLSSAATVTGIPFTNTDMTPYVLTEKSANPQVLLMLASSTQDLIFMQAAAAQNFKPVYIGNGGTMAESPMLTLPACQNDCYRVAEFATSGPGYKAFAKAVKSTGVAPSDQGAENYAITLTFLHILKLSGNNLSWSHFEKVADSVKNFSTNGLYAPISFSSGPNGHLASPDTIVEEVKNHQWATIGSFIPEPASLLTSP